MHEAFMQRCIQLAAAGLGRVAPNPLVGCVIVDGNEVIGEGYHEAFGKPHAEWNAVHAVADQARLRRSRLYVSLEPCCHHGKTPPCTDLLLARGITEVVVGMRDPDERVAGRGIALLQEQGVRVITPVAEAGCAYVNRRFLAYHREKRPYVILKWAESRDGFIAPADPAAAPRWISNALSRTLVHRWRSQEDAVLVGTQTAFSDNPRLDVRHVTGRNPLRIVTDRHGRLPRTLHLFDGKAPTVVFTETIEQSAPNLHYVRTDFDDFPGQMLRQLHAMQVQSVIVEGGAWLLNAFFAAGTWDEARRFTGDVLLGNGLQAPAFHGNHRHSERIGTDLLDTYFR